MSNLLSCPCGHTWETASEQTASDDSPLLCPNCGSAVADPTAGAADAGEAMSATVVLDPTDADKTEVTPAPAAAPALPRLLRCPCGYQWKDPGVTTDTDGALVCPQCGEVVETAKPTGGDALMTTELPTQPVPAAGDQRAARQRPLPGVPGYDVLGVLGHGGMGVVYKARQKSLNRIVALKMVLDGAYLSNRSLARFRAEAEAVARLQHPNIVQVYEVGEHEGRPFFSLEYVDGGSLAEKYNGEPQPVRPTVELLEVIARAVDWAHQHGIIHRDLKPANILLAGAGERGQASGVRESGQRSGFRGQGQKFGTKAQATGAPLTADSSLLSPAKLTPKITDFGLAKRLDDDSGMTKSGDVMGTPSYMAPEQAQGRVRDIGPATDVYALGAILYEALTGRPPFRAETAVDTLLQVSFDDPVSPSQMRTKVPTDVETICLTCLHKEPQKRYAGAGALAEDLRRFLAGEPIQARPAGVWERAVKWARRRPAVAALLGVSTLAAVAFLTVSLAFVVKLNATNADLRTARDAADQEAEEARRQTVLAEVREREANVQRTIAEQQKAIAHQERLRAEANFLTARDAVDLMLTRVAQEHLKHVPGMAREREKLLQAALTFYESLPRQDASTDVVRQETGRAHRRVGDIARHLGKIERARAAYLQAIALFAELAKEFPQQPAHWSDLALSQFELGRLLRDAGNLPEAKKQYEQALGHYQHALKDDNRAPKSVQGLARTWNDLGLLLRNQNRLADARAAYERALDLQKELIVKFGKEPDYVQDLAGSYNDRGILFQHTGEPEKAEQDYRAALPYIQALESQYPDNVDYRSRLASTYSNLGTVLRTLALAREDPADRDKGLQEAEAMLQAALTEREKITVAFPTVPKFQRELAIGCGNLAAVRVELNHLSEAAKDFERAKTVFRALVNEFPTVPDYQSGLAGTLDNLATVLRRQGQGEQALKLLQEARGHLDAALKDHPQQPEYRQLLRLHHRILAETLLQLGKATEARQVVEELPRRFPKDAAETYEAAARLARLSWAAGTEKALAADQRKAVAAEFAARAVQLLAEALRQGYRPATPPAEDPAFVPLRNRPDFRELVGLKKERT